MDNKVPNEIEQLGSDLPPKLQFENAADATGLWFAAAAIFAVLAAGVIVYRGGNSDIVTASNEPMPAAAHSGAVLPPVLPRR